jgi:hypothetical protein
MGLESEDSGQFLAHRDQPCTEDFAAAILPSVCDTRNIATVATNHDGLGESIRPNVRCPQLIIRAQDDTQLPAIVSLALPALPPPIPSLVRNGVKYSQIFTVMLDDLSGVIVALGFVIWASGLIVR